MNADDVKDRMNTLLFTNLIMMLGSSAMQQLGKQVNPLTNKAEVNLDGAQLTIDMLGMIEEKTRGNLADDESRTLSDLLASLRMNYVQTAKDQPDASAEPTAAPAEDTPPGETGAPETAAAEAADNEERPDPKEPKYHKSYGD